jgi:hypothetical protein
MARRTRDALFLTPDAACCEDPDRGTPVGTGDPEFRAPLPGLPPDQIADLRATLDKGAKRFLTRRYTRSRAHRAVTV